MKTMTRRFAWILALAALLATAQAHGEPKTKGTHDDLLHVTYYFMPG
jgi:hypothetical protein